MCIRDSYNTVARLVCFGALAFSFCTVTDADLVIDISGFAGTNTVHIDFSGESFSSSPGTIRTLNAGGIAFNFADTFDVEPINDIDGDGIGDTGLLAGFTFSDLVLAGTGNAQISIGGVSESIAGIFLDDDSADIDDFGIRTANPLSFGAGQRTVFSGSLTVSSPLLDITNFSVGSFVDTPDLGPRFTTVGGGGITINVSVKPIPEPSAFALMAGMAAFAACRRRK